MQRDSTLRTDLCGGAAVIALIAAQAASAQTTSEAPTPAEAASAPAAQTSTIPAAPTDAASAPTTAKPASSGEQDVSKLGTVVVTASKRPEFLKDVPSSIAVLDGFGLRKQGAARLEDYVARVPGLVLNAQSVGQQQITIRGLSTGAGGAPTVAVYVDEAPYGASTSGGAGGLLTPDVDAIDLERIEVLRGPQGTVYGASNIGGLLKYVLIAPDPSEFGGEVGMEGNKASHGGAGYAVRGRVNVPIVQDQFAILASGYYRRDPGFVDDAGRGLTDVDKTRVYGGRLSALWTPSPGLKIKAEAIAQDRRAKGFAEIDVDPATLTPVYGDYEQRRAVGADFFGSKMRQYILTGSYDFNGIELTATTSYNTLKDVGGADYTQAFGPIATGFGPEFNVPNLGFSAVNDIAQRKFSQEIRLSGKLDKAFDWTGGVFFSKESSDTVVTLPTFDSVTGAALVLPALLVSDIQTKYAEYAGFGEITYHATSKLDLIGGLRYAANKQSNVSTSSGALVGPQSTVLSDSKDSSTTFSLSPRYKFNPNLMAYARVASGYRPGGANGGYGPTPSYAPDTVVNYEVGFKASAPAQKIYLDVALFSIDWKKIQLLLRDSNGLSYIDNAGRARSQGVEAALTYSPVGGLTLGASAAYTDAKLRQDIPSGQYGLSGDSLPYSPRLKASLSADYSFTLGENLRSFVGASYFYTDKVLAAFSSDAATPRIGLPSFSTVDLRAGVTINQVRIGVFVKNVGDNRGYNGTRPLTLDAAGRASASLIQPRTLGVSLAASF